MAKPTPNLELPDFGRPMRRMSLSECSTTPTVFSLPTEPEPLNGSFHLSKARLSSRTLSVADRVEKFQQMVVQAKAENAPSSSPKSVTRSRSASLQAPAPSTSSDSSITENRRHLSDQLLLMEFHLLNALESKTNTPPTPPKPVKVAAVSVLPPFAKHAAVSNKFREPFMQSRYAFRQHWKQLPRCLKIMPFVVCFLVITFVVIAAVSFLVPKCNVMGCKREVLLKDLQSRLLVQGDSVRDIAFVSKNFSPYPHVSSVLDMALTNSSSSRQFPQFTLLNVTERSHELARPSGHTLPRLETSTTFASPIGKAYCGKLSPYDSILGFALANQADALSDDVFVPKNGSDHVPGVQVPRRRGNVTAHPLGGYSADDLADCCVMFFSPYSDDRVRAVDVHLSVQCWSDAEAGNGRVWKGFNVTTARFPASEYVQTSGLELSNGGSQVSVQLASHASERWLRGLTISASANLEVGNRTMTRVLKRTDHLQGTVSLLIPTMPEDQQVTKFRVQNRDVELRGIAPSPWLTVPDSCFTRYVVDLKFVGSIQDATSFDVYYAGEPVTFESNGCPRNYILVGEQCIEQSMQVSQQIENFIEVSVFDDDIGMERAFMSRITPLVTRDSLEFNAPGLDVVLMVRHPFLNRTFWQSLRHGFQRIPHLYLLSDKTCVKRGFFGLTDGISKKTWDWVRVGSKGREYGLGWKAESGTVGIPMRTAGRTGSILMAFNADVSMPTEALEVRVIVPGCPEKICPVAPWTTINPPLYTLGDNSWNGQSIDMVYKRVIWAQHAMRGWLSSLASVIDGASMDLTNRATELVAEYQTDRDRNAWGLYRNARTLRFGYYPLNQYVSASTALVEGLLYSEGQSNTIASGVGFWPFTLPKRDRASEISGLSIHLKDAVLFLRSYLYNTTADNDRTILMTSVTMAKSTLSEIGQSTASQIPVKPVLDLALQLQKFGRPLVQQLLPNTIAITPAYFSFVRVWLTAPQSINTRVVPQVWPQLRKAVKESPQLAQELESKDEDKDITPFGILTSAAALSVLQDPSFNYEVRLDGKVDVLSRAEALLFNEKTPNIDRYTFCARDTGVCKKATEARQNLLKQHLRSVGQLAFVLLENSPTPTQFPFEMKRGWFKETDAVFDSWITRLMLRSLRRLVAQSTDTGVVNPLALATDLDWNLSMLQVIMLRSIKSRERDMVLTRAEMAVVELMLSAESFIHSSSYGNKESEQTFYLFCQSILAVAGLNEYN